MKNPALTFFVIALTFFVLQSSAQETLKQKYDNMLENTETYEQYKVIPRTQLNAFWTEVTDSLNQKNRKIQELRAETDNAKTLANQARLELSEVQTKLDESLKLNDTIYFLGIPFSKLGYHIMVWMIVIVLAVLAVITYFMFIRSNTVTTRTRRDYEGLLAEFEKHRNKAREQQVKLKRELQTAVNKLNERRS